MQRRHQHVQLGSHCSGRFSAPAVQRESDPAVAVDYSVMVGPWQFSSISDDRCRLALLPGRFDPWHLAYSAWGSNLCDRSPRLDAQRSVDADRTLMVCINLPSPLFLINGSTTK